jgi:hypothetical protein
MAAGDSSVAVIARDEGADRQLQKKQKQQEPAAEDAKGANPLDPRFSDYDPKKGKYVYTRFRHSKIDPDTECTSNSPPALLDHASHPWLSLLIIRLSHV